MGRRSLLQGIFLTQGSNASLLYLLHWQGGSLPLMPPENPTKISATAKSLQSCPTLCNPIEGSLPWLRLPWDSPGKNTGVGCYFLLQCMKVKSKSEVAQLGRLLATPWTAAYQAPWDFPGKNTGVGYHFLLQGKRVLVFSSCCCCCCC